MSSSYIYAAFMLLMATTFILIVPKQNYKRCLIYGILCGSIADALLVALLTLLKLIQYKNMGPFSILGMFSSWMPITWAYGFALYFYLLPAKRHLQIPYICAWAFFTYGVGLVFQNFGLFEYKGGFKYVAPLVFLIWYSAAAWFYIKDNKMDNI